MWPHPLAVWPSFTRTFDLRLHSSFNSLCSIFASIGQFPLWVGPAGNHGTCITHLGLDIYFDEYNYHDVPQARLIEGIGHKDFQGLCVTIMHWKNKFITSNPFQFLCMPSGSLLLSIKVVYHFEKTRHLWWKDKQQKVLHSISQLTVVLSLMSLGRMCVSHNSSREPWQLRLKPPVMHVLR